MARLGLGLLCALSFLARFGALLGRLLKHLQRRPSDTVILAALG
ncbi:hypothetical protein ACRAWD_31650 [Caulobacter segnis]